MLLKKSVNVKYRFECLLTENEGELGTHGEIPLRPAQVEMQSHQTADTHTPKVLTVRHTQTHTCVTDV